MAVGAVSLGRPGAEGAAEKPAAKASRGILAHAGLIATLAVHELVVLAYVYFATGGSFGFRPGAHYYGHLAEAFAAGQLHLKLTPSPELLALPDPYDPFANAPFRARELHDHILYDGKYYSPFGPVPAVVRAGWLLLTGQQASAMLVETLVGLVACAWLWLLLKALRERIYPDVPDWLVRVTYLCCALGGITLYLLVGPITYHELYLWAACFVLGGLYWWVRALDGSRRAVWQLALAGFLFGCAFGCRPAAIFYAVGPGLVQAWRWARAPRSGRAVAGLLAYGLGLAAACAPILAYNYARFGSVAEFGTRYSMAGFKTDTPGLFGPQHVASGISTYLLTVPHVIPYYPFQYGPANLPITTDRRFIEQPFTSVLLMAPLVVLAPLTLRLLLPGAPPGAGAVVAAAGIGVLGAFSVLATWFWTSGRYLHDVVPVASVLGGLGLWSLRPACGIGRGRRVAYGALVGIALVASVGMGVTYGMSSQDRWGAVARTQRAYELDSVLASVVRWLNPSAWPSSYLAPEVARRPNGLFAPADGVLSLPVRPELWITGLRVDSLFPGPTRVRVDLDGRTVADGVLASGPGMLQFGEPILAQSQGEVTLKLSFPDEPAPRSSGLWPVRVPGLALSPTRPAAPP